MGRSIALVASGFGTAVLLAQGGLTLMAWGVVWVVAGIGVVMLAEKYLVR